MYRTNSGKASINAVRAVNLVTNCLKLILFFNSIKQKKKLAYDLLSKKKLRNTDTFVICNNVKTKHAVTANAFVPNAPE